MGSFFLSGTSSSVVTNSILGNFHLSNTVNPVIALMQHDLSFYLPDDILFKTDSSSMFYGLELRSPFLNSDVATKAFALQLSSDNFLKYNKNVLKEILSPIFRIIVSPGRVLNPLAIGYVDPTQWCSRFYTKTTLMFLV